MVPKCVGKAVTLLEELTQFDRENLQHLLQYLKLHNEDGINNTELQELEKFVAKNKVTDDHGKLWSISTHQFRCTFAVL